MKTQSNQYNNLTFQISGTVSHLLTWSHYYEILVEYATASITNKILLAKYQLYLPDKQTLQDKLTALLQNQDEQNNDAL